MPGNSNNVGNIQTRKKGRAKPEPFYGISYKTVRGEIEAVLRLWHDRYWDETKGWMGKTGTQL